MLRDKNIRRISVCHKFYKLIHCFTVKKIKNKEKQISYNAEKVLNS